MKIGYVGNNLTLGCTSSSTFRLANFSYERFIKTVENNLACLEKILAYNIAHKIKYFRITSDLVPFAKHPVNTIDWPKIFKKRFERLGKIALKNDIRITMHPDQFVVLNSPSSKIVLNSINELIYHQTVLDLMKLGNDCKIQIHLGGAYGDKQSAIKRFVENFQKLPQKLKNRLVLENDDRIFSVSDLLEVSKIIQIPVVVDTLHHELLGNDFAIEIALEKAAATWSKKDGLPMVDFSTQDPQRKRGAHQSQLDEDCFTDFIRRIKHLDFDIMIEIKDKQASALKAMEIVKRV